MRIENFSTIRSPGFENSNAILDDQQEINDYLNKLDPQYRNEVTELESQLGAPSQSTKLTMLIPVADHQEGNNIGDALENYAQQTANPSDYEIILFLNHPETDKLGNPISADNTEQEIRRIMTKYPNLPIKIMKKTLPVSKAKISLIKYLSDVALQRHSSDTPCKCCQNIESMIMVSNDADNKVLPQI
jgi:hypothetical protein